MWCRRLFGLLLAALAGAPSAFAQPEPAATLGRPVAILGRPRPMSAGPESPTPAPIRLASFEPEPPPLPTPAEQIIGPSSGAPPFSPPSDLPPRSSYSSPSEDFLSGRPSAPRRAEDDHYLHTSNFGERLREKFDEWMQPGQGCECDTRRWFQSDHAFDYFASPVSMPFLLEDP